MVARRWRKAPLATMTAMIGLLGLGGCGFLQARLTTTPNRLTSGHNLSFDVHLTNPSQCPKNDILALVIPFTHVTDVPISGTPDDVQALYALMTSACTGQPRQLPNGATCSVADGLITCDSLPDSFGTTDSGEITLGTPQGQHITCRRNGTHLTCQLPNTGESKFAAASLAGSGLLCAGSGLVFCYDPDELAPGQFVTGMFNLPAPLVGDTYQNLLFVISGSSGVCKDGTNVGHACSAASGCPDGSPDNCGDGVCTSGSNPGAGCDNDAECGTGGVCTICDGPSGLTMPSPLDCTNVTVAGTAAPLLSPLGILGAVLLLGATGAVSLGVRRWLGRN